MEKITQQYKYGRVKKRQTSTKITSEAGVVDCNKFLLECILYYLTLFYKGEAIPPIYDGDKFVLHPKTLNHQRKSAESLCNSTLQ